MLGDDDIELMKQVQQDRRGAFDTLYRKHASRVFGFFLRSTLSREESEELVQETFFKLYRLRAGWEPRASFNTYLFTVARSVLLNNWRGLASWRNGKADGADVAETPGATDTEADVAAKTMVSRVADALGALPEKQRTAVLLVRYEGMGYEEASVVMGVGPKAIKSLLNRARERLVAEVKP